MMWFLAAVMGAIAIVLWTLAIASMFANPDDGSGW